MLNKEKLRRASGVSKLRRHSENNNSIYYSLLLYSICIFIDPTDSIFHLKLITFSLCVGVWIINGCSIRYNWECLVFFILILIGSYGQIRSLCYFGTFDSSYQVANLKVLILNFLIFPICLISFDRQQQLFIIAGIVLSVVVIIAYILYTVLGFGANLYEYVHDSTNDTVMISNRAILGLPILAFFHKGSPILLFAISKIIISCKNMASRLLVLVLVFPLLISGSRMPFICGIIIIIGSYIIKSRIPNLIKLYGGMFLILGIIGILIMFASDSQEGSVILKFGAFRSYLNVIGDTFSTLLFGRGVGSLVYIPGRGLEPQSELSFLDLFNWYGVIIGCIFFVVLLLPIWLTFNKNIKSEIRGFGLAYLLYMCIAATNPLLFSSTGWFVVCCGLINFFKYYNDLDLYCHL